MVRERAGLTQRALGQKIKKSQSWVQKCEIGFRRVDVAEFVLSAGDAGPIRAREGVAADAQGDFGNGRGGRDSVF
jgi:hypothetical protein